MVRAVRPRRVAQPGRPLHGLAVVDGAALVADLHPAAPRDDDEEALVGARLRAPGRHVARERQLGDACPRVAPDGACLEPLRAQWPPRVESPGRSAGSPRRARGSAAQLRLRARGWPWSLRRADRGIRVAVALLAQEALTAQHLVVGLDEGREADEADPDEGGQADDDGDEHEDEVELEDAVDEQQPEDGQAGPEQPLLERHERWVAVQPPRLDVVEDDRADEQEEARPRRSGRRGPGSSAG